MLFWPHIVKFDPYGYKLRGICDSVLSYMELSRTLIWLINWPLSNKAPLVANPCRSVYIAHKMAADGVFSTPSDAILWAIYTDLHRSATRGAELESGQLNRSAKHNTGKLLTDSLLNVIHSVISTYCLSSYFLCATRNSEDINEMSYRNDITLFCLLFLWRN